MPLVLGVDSSTTSTTVELRDADDGHLYASGRAAHPSGPGEDAEEPRSWWNGLVEARRVAGGALGVAAVSVTASAEGVVVVDAQDDVLAVARPSRPTDAARVAAELRSHLDPRDWVRACGSLPRIGSALVALAWLRQVDPQTFAGIARVLLPHDWLTHRLSRAFVTDRGDASTTGYWSPRDDQWNPEILALLDGRTDWAARLPTVLGPVEAAGDRDGVVIAAGTGTPMATALGLALDPGDLVVSLQANALFTVRDRPTEDSSGAVAGLADATGRFLPLVDVPDVMGALETMARLLGVDVPGLDQLARSVPAGSGGVVVVPPAPPLVPRCVIAGVTPYTLPGQVARATFEGLACYLLDAREALRAADVPISGKIVLVGKGARSHTLQRAIADLFGRPVAVPQSDTVATGACVNAAAVLHGTPPAEVGRAWKLGPSRGIDPDDRVDAADIHARFRAERERSSSSTPGVGSA